MKSEEAAIFMQCHCPGLPGTEDPRVGKAVRIGEKDVALQGELTRMRALDERCLTAVEQVMLPAALLARLAASDGAGVPAAATAAAGAAAGATAAVDAPGCVSSSFTRLLRASII